jgi:RimJ/RimL family protein N-acetyltransferase
MPESAAIQPAYRLVTPRLVIRCWEPRDAAGIKDAIEASVEHLRPWMPWAHNEPTDLQTKIELLRRFRGEFDLGQNFVYGIFSADEARVLGGTGLHPRLGPHALEIGYWIRADAVKQGFVTETAAVLTRAGFAIHRVDRMEIHCDAANTASAAVAERLGYTLEATLRRRLYYEPQVAHDTMVWTMFSEEFADSPAAKVHCEAFDSLGRPLEL